MATRKRIAGVLPIQHKDGTTTYRAQVYDRVTKRTQTKTFPSPQAAKRWREDRYAAMRAGTERVLESMTIAELRAEWMEGLVAGTVLTKGNRPYKASALRELDASWRIWIGPTFAHVKVRDLRTVHVQRAVDELVREGRYAPSSIANHLNGLRVLLKYAVRTERAMRNACDGVGLPSMNVAEKQIVAPETAKRLVDMLEDPVDRALWATAFFAGLRRGELLALRWSDVDLLGRTIKVQRSYDRGIKRTPEAEANPTIVGWPEMGGGAFVTVKSDAGRRTVGIPAALVPYLAALNGTGDELVFPNRQGKRASVFIAETGINRARERWPEEYRHLGLHAARHTYASTMIAAGYNIKQVSQWMGHSKVEITWNRYGHLYPDSTVELLGKLDAHLAERISA